MDNTEVLRKRFQSALNQPMRGTSDSKSYTFIFIIVTIIALLATFVCTKTQVFSNISLNTYKKPDFVPNDDPLFQPFLD